MPSDRRQFLSSTAAAVLGVPLADALAKTDEYPARRLDTALFLDVEDIFSPPELGNDDSIREVATILTEEGLRANFMVVADRALVLKERGRKDVIDGLGPHEVGPPHAQRASS